MYIPIHKGKYSMINCQLECRKFDKSITIVNHLYLCTIANMIFYHSKANHINYTREC